MRDERPEGEEVLAEGKQEAELDRRQAEIEAKLKEAVAAEEAERNRRIAELEEEASSRDQALDRLVDRIVLRRFQLLPRQEVPAEDLTAWTGLQDVPTIEVALERLVDAGDVAVRRIPEAGKRWEDDAPRYGLSEEALEVLDMDAMLGDWRLACNDLEEAERVADGLRKQVADERGRRIRMEDVAAGGEHADAALRIIGELVKLEGPTSERTLESIGMVLERYQRRPRKRGDGTGVLGFPLDVLGGFVRGLLESAERKIVEADETATQALEKTEGAYTAERKRADGMERVLQAIRDLVDEVTGEKGPDYRTALERIDDAAAAVLPDEPVAVGGDWHGSGSATDFAVDSERAIAAGRKLLGDLGLDEPARVSEEAALRIGKALAHPPFQGAFHIGGVLPRGLNTLSVSGFASHMKPGLYRGERTADGFRFVQVEEGEDDAELRKVDELFGETRSGLARQIADAELRASVAEERAGVLQAHLDELRPHLRALVAELAGDEPAWWVRAAQALERIREAEQSMPGVRPDDDVAGKYRIDFGEVERLTPPGR